MLGFIRKGYCFDDAYNGLVSGLRSFAQKFRQVQTGDLNYNLWGMALAFFVLALVLFTYGGIL